MMPEITEAELKKQIKSADFQKLYVLYGEEKYLVEYYAGRILAKAGAEGPADFNRQKFDGGETGVDDIAAAVEALPVLARRKCVAVSDLDVPALRAGEANKLGQLLGDLPESCVLVIYLPSIAFDERRDRGWKKFLAQAGKAGATVSLRGRTQAQMEKLLCAGAARRGCALSRQNAARLLGCCGTGMHTALNELNKLCAFTGSGEITAQTVDRLAVRNLEARVFDLSKAVLAGDGDRAYRILGGLFYQNEEPVAVLAVLAGAYLDLYRVRAAVQSGRPATEPAKYFDYRRKEFRLTNAERLCGRFSSSMLRESLDALLETDLALKSARGDRRLMLEKLVARLLVLAKGERAG